MVTERTHFAEAQNALADLARATGIAYAMTPTVGAMSLFADYRQNVYAMVVTGLAADASVERGVTPYGDPPMTAREFTAAARIAEAAVYTLYQCRHHGRIPTDIQAIAADKMRAASEDIAPEQKMNLLLAALSAQLGIPDIRIVENALGLVSFVEPSPFGSHAMTIGQLANAVAFALEALYHHNRTRA